jgi:hypothetical protein
VQGFRVWAGLVGLVTAHLSGTVKGGYGSPVATTDVSGGTWLANLEVRYTTLGVIDAKLGWLHHCAADIGLQYSLYTYHRIYGDLKWLFGRFTARLAANWDYVHYVLNDVTGPVLQIVPALDYEVARWLYLGASFTYTYRSSSQSSIPAFD